MKTLRWAIFCTLLFISCSVHAATLHVVIAVNTDDETIGSGVKADLFLIQQEVENIARYTGLRPSEKVFAGEEFDSRAVLDYIKALDVRSDDVVIYYHNGHGFRSLGKDDCWPALDFGLKPALDFAEVVAIIRSKPQRFALMLAECCNSLIPDYALPSFYHRTMDWAWRTEKYRRLNYRKLYLEQKGMIVATSASPGEYAWIDTSLGAIFTLALLGEMENQCAHKSGDIEWIDILQKAQENAFILSQTLETQQLPIFTVNLKPL